jgi:hypothetical protein
MGFQAKIPDIEKCVEVVATLQAKKGTGEVRLIPDFLYQIILGPVYFVKTFSIFIF